MSMFMRVRESAGATEVLRGAGGSMAGLVYMIPLICTRIRLQLMM